MKTENHEPTCPTCGYDLAGIIREDGTATCPECGSVSDSHRYSLPISRWPIVSKLIITHAVLFFLLSAALCLVPLGGVGGSIWLLVQLCILPSSVVLIEHQLRKSNPDQQFTPTIARLSFIVACYTITLLLFGILVYVVLSAIAYSTL